MAEREIELTAGKAIVYFIVAILAVVFIVMIVSSFYIVNAGERAVLLKFGEAEPSPINEGLHFKVPIRDSVVKMDIKTLKYDAKASAASQDLQTVSTEVTVNYHLSPDSVVKMYKSVGLNYQDTLIQPAVQEVVKASTAKYTAEQLITKREEVKSLIDSTLRDRLLQYNIIVDAISITNFDFSASFNAAIEAKVTTEQNALAEKNKVQQIQYQAQQKVAEAEGNKQSAILEAQGKAEAIRIQAEAIKAQGGAEYVQLQAIQRWNGNVPTFVGGSNGIVPFVNIPLGQFSSNTSQ